MVGVVAQWQSTGGLRGPGFNSRRHHLSFVIASSSQRPDPDCVLIRYHLSISLRTIRETWPLDSLCCGFVLILLGSCMYGWSTDLLIGISHV